MVVHAFIPALRRQSQEHLCDSGASLIYLQREFQDNQSYTEKPCLEKKEERKKKERTRYTMDKPIILAVQSIVGNTLLPLTSGSPASCA